MRTIPGVTYAQVPRAAQYASALHQPPKLVVVHATDNPTSNAAGEARYAATRTDARSGWTSCHAYVDAGGVVGSLSLDLQAWSAMSWANGAGWHVELCGVSDHVPEAVQRVGAALVRQLCLLGGVPMQHLDGSAIRALHAGTRTQGGITGHGDITAAAIDGNNHTDPGGHFDWTRFIGWVTGNQGEDDMTPEQAQALERVDGRLAALYYGMPTNPYGAGPMRGEPNQVKAQLDRIEAKPAGEVAVTAELTRALGDQVAATLAPQLEQIAERAAEAAVRRVLGAVDGAVPPDAGTGRA